MTSVLIDTSAYSAHFRGDPAVRGALAMASEVVLSPVVLGELRAGFRGGRHALRNEEDLAAFLGTPRARVVEIDEVTSRYYAAFFDELRRLCRPIPANDIWIAASSAQHGLTILTLDAHFLAVPGVLVDYRGKAPGHH